MADPLDRVRMIVLEREMAAKKTVSAKAAKRRLEFTVKAATPRAIEHYSGEPGKRVRTETPMVDVMLAGDFDIELRGLTPREAKVFRIGAECIMRFVRNPSSQVLGCFHQSAALRNNGGQCEVGLCYSAWLIAHSRFFNRWYVKIL
jgi:hypothetical protein